jgi:hypothetical protein
MNELRFHFAELRVLSVQAYVHLISSRSFTILEVVSSDPKSQRAIYHDSIPA